ncbi:hypothetical protein HN709_01960 [Candidatus Peregrinibacteria bacterium]|jgi:cytidine deaminase|nr:hypothetical protein [Candidatus Peregrinibacteria bacterium]MBT7736428.1 hypothetical protein [Candidatus Peregrinibacteria bacterium]
MESHTKVLRYETTNDITDLPEDEQELYRRAMEASQTAYAPYSGFKVGSALMNDKGEVIIGSNQENANYKVSCGERVVLDQAGVKGWKQGGTIRKLALYGAPENGASSTR